MTGSVATLERHDSPISAVRADRLPGQFVVWNAAGRCDVWAGCKEGAAPLGGPGADGYCNPASRTC
jgi:hypothetical protein